MSTAALSLHITASCAITDHCSQCYLTDFDSICTVAVLMTIHIETSLKAFSNVCLQKQNVGWSCIN